MPQTKRLIPCQKKNKQPNHRIIAREHFSFPVSLVPSGAWFPSEVPEGILRVQEAAAGAGRRAEKRGQPDALRPDPAGQAEENQRLQRHLPHLVRQAAVALQIPSRKAEQFGVSARFSSGAPSPRCAFPGGTVCLACCRLLLPGCSFITPPVAGTAVSLARSITSDLAASPASPWNGTRSTQPGGRPCCCCTPSLTKWG